MKKLIKTCLLLTLFTPTAFANSTVDSTTIQVGTQTEIFDQGNRKSTSFWGYMNAFDMSTGAILSTNVNHNINTLGWIRMKYHNSPDFCGVQLAISGTSSEEANYISSISKISFAAEEFIISSGDGDFYNGPVANMSALAVQQVSCATLNKLELDHHENAAVEIKITRDIP